MLLAIEHDHHKDQAVLLASPSRFNSIKQQIFETCSLRYFDENNDDHTCVKLYRIYLSIRDHSAFMLRYKKKVLHVHHYANCVLFFSRTNIKLENVNLIVLMIFIQYPRQNWSDFQLLTNKRVRKQALFAIRFKRIRNILN